MKSLNSEELHPPLEINPDVLNAETLRAVMESFILREGTDYGLHELPMEVKVENLKKKIQRKEVLLIFDPNTESVTFMTQREWTKLTNSSPLPFQPSEF